MTVDKNKSQELTPQTTSTFNKICKLKRDNVYTRKSWMLLAGDGGTNHITIQNQKKAESATGKVVLTRKEFERFIRFYQTGK